MMLIVHKPRLGQGPADPNRCCISVSDGSYFRHQCQRKIHIQTNFEGKVRGFCKQHDPARVKARRDAAIQKEKEESKRISLELIRKQRWSRANISARRTLEVIANGAENAQELANKALSLYPAKD